MHYILLWPELLFIGKLCITIIISFGIVCLKWIWKCLENANNDQMDVYFPDIGKIIIELASNLFFVRDGLAVHFYFVRSHRVLSF